MAERLGRPDLASAALDGVGSYYIAQGLWGLMAPVVQRRAELASQVADPMELADLHSMASWVHGHVGLYRDALQAAEDGFASASSATILVALDALDFRAVAKFRLGDWDGMLVDCRLIEELLGERFDTPPGYATDNLAARAFVMEARGDQGEANRLLERIRWLERAEERPSPAWALWSARTLSRRGEFAEAGEILRRAHEHAGGYGRDYLLEARCEVTADAEDWAAAPAVADEARAHSVEAGLLALPHVAGRLEGLVAANTGDPERARQLLSAAAEGFDEVGAEWEAAVARLHLARALVHGIAAGRIEARRLLESIVPVFDRVRSLRELVAAGTLLDAVN
jgi:tetratricopeptide (TPR) repeat protein